LKALLNCDSFIIDVGLERRREFWKRQKQTTSRTNGLRSDPPSHIQGVDDTKDLIYMYDIYDIKPSYKLEVIRGAIIFQEEVV
jgi:hypothetical protein